MSGVPVQTVALADPAFPRRLRDARASLPGLPDRLDVQGTLGDPALAVAIVGARAAYQPALDLAAAVARTVVARGGVVVSGGAIGIDGAAHRAALGAGGATVAVLGTGIDVAYPVRHTRLFAEITRAGALVSSFDRGVPPIPYHFVRRNPIIAALADVVVVLGASGRSGALHTAAAARRLGRPVLAMPGTEGGDRLLAGGAAVVERPDDLERALDGAPRRLVAPAPTTGTDAHAILDALSPREPRDLEELAVRTGLSLRAAQRAIADLELRGLALLAPGQAYLRSSLAAAPA